MFEKLIESKNKTTENKRLGGFLLTTSTGAFSVLTVAFIYSLFSYNLALGSDNLNLTTLVAPIPVTEKEQPVEQHAAPQKQQSTAQTISKLPTRREIIQRVEENPNAAPKEISVARNEQMSRPNSNFLVSSVDTNPSASGIGTNTRAGSETGTGIGDTLEKTSEAAKTVVEVPPAVKIKPKEEVVAAAPKKNMMVSSGVINGKATDLVKPVYSTAAKMVRAQGEVKVQVTIDEEGRVISASAISGHPLLTQSALSAARLSKFSPTLLSGQKVKVTGIILYSFKV